MYQWVFNGLRALVKPISIAMIVGVVAAWQFTSNYNLQLLWRKTIDPTIGHIVHSSSGVVRLYLKADTKRSWFVGREANSPLVELQVPEGAYFWGKDYFSPDGKWYAINGSYKQRNESILFVFETCTGRMICDIASGTTECACFTSNDLMVCRNDRGFYVWDLRQNCLKGKSNYEQLYLIFELTASRDGSRIYSLGPVMKNMNDEKPEEMQLRCWSISEQRELFRKSFTHKDVFGSRGLHIDESGRHLFGLFVGITMDAQGRSYLDCDTVYCWNADDGLLIRTYSNIGGESCDPIYPLSMERYLVCVDAAPHPLRALWKQWVKSDPEWLKSLLPNQSKIDVRDTVTGQTFERLPVPYGHWPRDHTTQGKYLETYATVNGQDEIAYWRIEECDRLTDALKIGISAMLGTWIGLLALGRILSTSRHRRKNYGLVHS